jgi:hypothetical protein
VKALDETGRLLDAEFELEAQEAARSSKCASSLTASYPAAAARVAAHWAVAATTCRLWRSSHNPAC